jgi:hypothetical protein
VPDDLTGFALAAAACVLGATALAVAVRVSRPFRAAIAITLALTPAIGFLSRFLR